MLSVSVSNALLVLCPLSPALGAEHNTRVTFVLLEHKEKRREKRKRNMSHLNRILNADPPVVSGNQSMLDAVENDFNLNAREWEMLITDRNLVPVTLNTPETTNNVSTPPRGPGTRKNFRYSQLNRGEVMEYLSNTDNLQSVLSQRNSTRPRFFHPARAMSTSRSRNTRSFNGVTFTHEPEHGEYWRCGKCNELKPRQHLKSHANLPNVCLMFSTLSRVTLI